jgi:midasin
MAENRCGALALEALTCIARALSRLEVGDLGVVAFGAAGRGVRTLHPLGTPFTDASGPALVSSFSFSGDNTVADAPAGALLDALDAQLSAARENHRGGSEQLQQLVLVIAGACFCWRLCTCFVSEHN